MRLLFWRPRRPQHSCAEHLAGRTGYRPGDTVVCDCLRMYELRLLTFGMDMSLRVRPVTVAADNDALAWVRNRTAEQARTAAQELREKAMRRG